MRNWLAIIVDDQLTSIRELQPYFESLETIRLVGTFTDAKKALAYMQEYPVDLVFLDVELVEMDGFMFMLKMPKHNDCQIILVTAHIKYEDQGYLCKTVDVLHKPVSQVRFYTAVDRFICIKQGRSFRTLYAESLNDWNQYIQVSDFKQNTFTLIWIKDIVYIENHNKSTLIYLQSQSNPLNSNTSLKEVLRLVPMNFFKQCSKCTAFNINFFHSYSHGFVKMKNIERLLRVGNKKAFPEFWDFIKSKAI